MNMTHFMQLRVIGKAWTGDQRLGWHAGCVALFLVVAHVAMIFGMLDPTVLGWDGAVTMPVDHSAH